MTQVLKGIYVGGSLDACNWMWLSHNNITYVLNVTPHPSDAPAAGCFNYFEDQPRIVYKRCPIHDTPKENLGQWLEECIEFINEARKNKKSILVHCQMGASRSVSIVTAYIMKKKKIRYIVALHMIAQRRPRVQPNPGFLRQLKNFEKSLGIK